MKSLTKPWPSSMRRRPKRKNSVGPAIATTRKRPRNYLDLPDFIDQCATLFKRGLTHKEIATELGCSTPTVSKVLKARGLTRSRF